MDKYLEGLIKVQADAMSRIRDIVDRAESESRSISPEENADIDKASAAYEAAKAEADKVASYKERAAAVETQRAIIAPAIEAMRDDPNIAQVELGTNGWVARSWASVSRGDTPSLSMDSYRTIPLGVEARALSVGSQGAGTTFPKTFVDSILVYERTLNPMLNIARVIPRSTGAPFQVPTLTSDVTAGGTVTAEAGGITEGDATLAAPEILTYKMAHTQLYSAELDQDNVVGIEDALADAAARPQGIGWGSMFTHGDGSGKPYGFLARAANAGTAGGSADYGLSGKWVGWGDAATLLGALAAPYRSRATFQHNSYARIMQWRDSQNNPVFQPSLQAGVQDTLFGRPLVENPSMQAFGSANTAIAVGDFSRYYIVDVQPVRIDISRDYKFNTDQLALRVITRRGGDLVDTAAAKFLVSKAE